MLLTALVQYSRVTIFDVNKMLQILENSIEIRDDLKMNIIHN